MIAGWTVLSLLGSFSLTPDHSPFDSFDSSGNHVVTFDDADADADADTSNQVQAMVKESPIVIAYAVSFIKCGDKQTSSAGLVDASLILRHSVHAISSRNPSSGSKYDYKMYAIVHRQAEECSLRLKNMGFEILVVDPPVQQSEIRGEHLKAHIHKEWCCGHDEFVKLFAYTLPEQVIVHVDIDYAFYKPMDHLFDAIIYDKDSEVGIKARNSLELERPGEKLPDKIGAFITRDWGQVAPGKFPPAYQAGFLVARRDPSIVTDVLEVIREGNYTDGWGYGHGWGNSGHGGYVGAMAMQGLMAYFYDHVKPGNAVELNQCRHNHMGMDALYRSHPNFTPGRVKKEYIGGCRNTLEYCEGKLLIGEYCTVLVRYCIFSQLTIILPHCIALHCNYIPIDCQVTEFDKIYSVHYTMCRKPWQCMAIGSKSGSLPGGGRGNAIPTDVVNIDHCYMLHRRWHELRADFEKKLFSLTGDGMIFDSTKGEYKTETFLGHCNEDGNIGYQQISGKEETFTRVHELY